MLSFTVPSTFQFSSHFSSFFLFHISFHLLLPPPESQSLNHQFTVIRILIVHEHGLYSVHPVFYLLELQQIQNSYDKSCVLTDYILITVYSVLLLVICTVQSCSITHGALYYLFVSCKCRIARWENQFPATYA